MAAADRSDERRKRLRAGEGVRKPARKLGSARNVEPEPMISGQHRWVNPALLFERQDGAIFNPRADIRGGIARYADPIEEHPYPPITLPQPEYAPTQIDRGLRRRAIAARLR